MIRFLTFAFCLISASLTAAENRVPAVTTCRELADIIMRSTTDRCRFDVTARVLQVLNANTVMEIAIQDETGGVIIKGPARAKCAPGDLVRAEGFARNVYRTIPEATFFSVVRISAGTPPQGTPTDAEAVLEGRHDWQLIRLKGMIRDIFASEFSDSWHIFSLDCKETMIYVAMPRAKSNEDSLRKLIDAEVEVEAVCTPKDGSKRVRIGRVLHVAGLEAIRCLNPSASDPFDVPDLSQLERTSPSKIAYCGRHRVRGCVLASWDENTILLRTPAGEISKIECAEPTDCPAGTFIEAVGLPESDLQHINLISARWRPTEPFPLEERETFDLPQHPSSQLNYMAMADLHGDAVRFSGTLRTKPAQNSPSMIAYVDTGTQLVTLNVRHALSRLDDVPTGSRVQVTGVFVLQLENWRPRLSLPQINGYTVILRSPDDLEVLNRPPWWTTGRLVLLIVALIAILAIILVWNVALRRMATQKGQALFREQLGHVKADLRTEERTRLAVELHDTLAQNLTGVSMELEAAYDLRGESPKPMLNHLQIAAKALKSCRDELRNCLWDLRSMAMDETNMDKAILRTLQPHLINSSLSVRFNVPRQRLSDNLAHTVLRVIRELVINATSHGNATTIRIAGTLDDDRLLFSVTDNGSGFDPDSAPGILQGHFGLQGIRERIDEYGGSFTLESSPKSGTRASVEISLPS